MNQKTETGCPEAILGTSIKDIAKVFNVSKSALRFWEKNGYLSSKRNEVNDYRLYTKEEIFEIADFVVYRDFGIPLDEIKNISNSPAEYSKEILQSRNVIIKQQIQKLMASQKLLETKLQQLEELERLRKECYSFCELKPIRIMIWSLENPSILNYVQDPYHHPFCALSLPPYETCAEGVVISEDYHGDGGIIYESDGTDKGPYMEFLMKSAFADAGENDLMVHINAIRDMGYETGPVVFYYLTSGVENGTKLDYYKGIVKVSSS